MSRERHVFPTSEIPHKWAHQTQADARNPQGNLYFKGATIYSYRDSWPLARIYTKGAPTKGGRKGNPEDYTRDSVLVLTNSDKYGPTTAGHQHDVNCAARHLAQIAVPHVQTEPYETQRCHDHNIAHLVKVASEYLEKAQRAMQPFNVEWREREAKEAIEHAGQYMRFFGIRRKAPVFPAAEWEKARVRALSIAMPDPVRDAKRYKAQQRRRTKLHAALQSAFDTYCAQVATYNAAIVEARANAPDAAEYWREHGKWPASVEVDYALQPRLTIPGDNSYRGQWKARDKFATAGFALPELESTDGRPSTVLLRVDGETIVTSLGARVPLAAAPMVWMLVEREKAKGGREFAHIGNASRIRIGDYPIDSIGADGTLRAGCHVIPYAELERMARKLGLIEGAPA
jgi:hypothetical protein